MRSLVLLFPLILCSAIYGADKQPPRVIRSLTSFEVNAVKPCPVHHVLLQKGIVPIEYGMPNSGTRKFYLDSQKLFPKARSKFIAGCVVQEYTDAEVLYCPQCRQAEAAWNKKELAPLLKVAKARL